METDRLGIASDYEDAFGRKRATSDATRSTIIAAMRLEPGARRAKPRVCVIDLRKPNRPKLGKGQLRLKATHPKRNRQPKQARRCAKSGHFGTELAAPIRIRSTIGSRHGTC